MEGESYGSSSVVVCIRTDEICLQVPLDPPSNTQHPSKASGIAHVRVLVDENAIYRLTKQLTSIIGSQPIKEAGTEAVWVLDTPSSRSEHGSPQLILSAPDQDDERKALKVTGPGIYEVAFWIARGDSGGSAKTPYGKIVWHPLSSAKMQVE